MTIKYSDVNLGQIEAVLNKIGGLAAIPRLLDGELVVVEKSALVIPATPPIVKPVSTIIKPKRPFDLKIFGDDWRVWLGTEDGDGLTGEPECDHRSIRLTELDLALVESTIILRNRESYTTSTEQISRVKNEKPDHVRLDPSFALALRDEPEKYPDEWKGKAIFWDGLTVRGPGGSRYSVCSVWVDGGVELGCSWRGSHRRAHDPSALLASKSLAPVA